MGLEEYKMFPLLAIDTAFNQTGVLLAFDPERVVTRYFPKGRPLSEIITVEIKELCSETDHDLFKTKTVAINNGPGGFTGVRIGLAFAKGLCYAMNVGIYAINSLEAIASHHLTDGNVCCVALDAKQGEFYWAAFEKQQGVVIPKAISQPSLISKETVCGLIESLHQKYPQLVVACDEEVSCCKEGSLEIAPIQKPITGAVAKLAIAYANSGVAPSNPMNVEPFYLKEFKPH